MEYIAYRDAALIRRESKTIKGVTITINITITVMINITKRGWRRLVSDGL